MMMMIMVCDWRMTIRNDDGDIEPTYAEEMSQTSWQQDVRGAV